MSLISPKNFLAPFASTVNLVTIVVLALLFGIYRLSGGGVYTEQRATRATQPAQLPVQTRQNQYAPVPQQQQQLQPQLQQPQQYQPAYKPNTNAAQDPFGDLMKPSQQKKAPAGAAAGGDDNLNDIERQLGLRK